MYTMLDVGNCPYTPFEYINNSEHAQKRQQVFNEMTTTDKDINIRIHQIFPSESRQGVCYDWALAQAMPGIEKLKIPYSFTSKWVAYIIHTYCEQTGSPRNNDIAVYANCIKCPDKIFYDIKHFGIVTDQLRILSKWGDVPKIYEHSLFDIPSSYGDVVFFFTLRKDYKADCKILVQHLDKVIQNNPTSLPSIPLYTKCLEVLLRRLAYGYLHQEILNMEENYQPEYRLYGQLSVTMQESSRSEVVEYLLETCRHLDINCLNDDRQTPLIVAAEQGLPDVISVLLNYGADATATDLAGKTYLDYAHQSKYFCIKNIFPITVGLPIIMVSMFLFYSYKSLLSKLDMLKLSVYLLRYQYRLYTCSP